jgi:DNA polymerase-3 subunit gamma/tau
MSYVVLARRFRPQNFEDIIGQEHVSRTLKNAIKENRVAHAYLFSGPRGVGKTTAARILAKALNCKTGPTTEPCGKCANCMDIVSGNSIDVQEIDGASNRGIDEIRALRDNVKFAPASSKYKIYIIDEAHQITDAAFNALLKTLEEPPSHVVFILATTEAQKIPVTILSRCQRYRFRYLSASEISNALEKILKSEKYEIEKDALGLITEAAGGSLRDALSLLDQVISFVGGKITAKDIENLLGFLPKRLIATAMEAISKQDNAGLITLIKQVSDEGYSLMQVARDMREHFRKLMLFKLNPETLELTTEDRNILESQKNLFTTDWLIRSGRLLSKLLDEMRWSDQPRLVLELYMLKIAQPYSGLEEIISRIEKLESGMPEDNSGQDVNVQSQTRVQSSARPAAVETSSPAAPISEPEGEVPGQPRDFARTWAEVMRQLSQEKPLVANILNDAVLGGVAGGAVMLYAKTKFQEESIKRNQQLIEEILQQKTGKAVNLKVLVGAPPGAAKKTVKETFVVEGENSVAPVREVFSIEEQPSEKKEELPPDLLKITSKIPGKVVKKKQ